MFSFKTEPRVITDEVGVTRTIVGIQARIVDSIDIGLNLPFKRTFFIAFVLATGTIYGARNATTEEFIGKAIENGANEETARAYLFQICRLLEYGTQAEMYLAGQQLAALYGYTLLPIEEQDGNIIPENPA